MFDKEKFTPEFYDKLSDSEKKELVQIMQEDQLTDPLHIKALPKPIQNCIKSAVKSSAKAMEEETIAGYPVKWIEGIKSKDEMINTLITDNRERRIHDPSIYKLHGRVLHTFFDEPYPVMMPEDVKCMEENIMTNIVKKFRGFSHPVVFDEDGYLMTGTTQNFKLQQTCDKLEAQCDILDTEAPDRNGRIWKGEFLKRFSTTRFPLITPRGHKSWLWLKMMELQKSYEVNLMQTLETTLSTKIDLKSVIHMKWPKPEMSDTKAHNFRYGKMWQDQALINYATGDVSHIDKIILDSLCTFGPDINSAYGLSTPNLNDIDKKKLERVIKKGKMKK